MRDVSDGKQLFSFVPMGERRTSGMRLLVQTPGFYLLACVCSLCYPSLCISTGAGAGTRRTMRIGQPNGQLLTAFAFCICISSPCQMHYPIPSLPTDAPTPSAIGVCLNRR